MESGVTQTKSSETLQSTFDEAFKAFKRKDYDVAVSLLKSELPFLEACEDENLRYNYGKLLFSNYYARGGDWGKEASAFFETLLQTFPKETHPKLHLVFTQFQAQILRYNGSTQQSVILSEQCYELHKQLNLKDYAFLNLLTGLGYNYLHLSRYEDAYGVLNEAEELAKQEKYVHWLPAILSNQANIDSNISAYHESVSKLLRATKLSKNGTDPNVFINNLNELSIALGKLGKTLYCNYFGEKTLQLAEELGVYQIGCHAAERLFNHYLLHEQFIELKRLNEAYEKFLTRWSSERVQTVFIKQKLTLSIYDGNFYEAEKYAEQLIENLPHLFDNYELQHARLTLGDYYFAINNFERAAFYFKQYAEDILKSNTDEQASRIQSHQVRRRIAAVEQEKENAKKLAQAKQEFLANMSHEIRSPMHAIIGMSSLLSNEQMTDKQKQKVQVIERSANHLLNIINDILDSSKIDAGKMELEKIPFSLQEVVEDVNAIVKVRADEKQISFTIAVAGQVPANVEGDPTRLKQVLLNLLTNAVKFTHMGEVLLQVEPQNQQLHFTVRDTGIGISPERLQKIFEGYTQADSSTSRQYGGTGLGLKISRQLIELMGGQLQVQSEEGKGTVFQFSIPMVMASIQTAFNVSPEMEADFLAGKKILAADDNESNLLLIESMLQQFQQGIRFVKAMNGRKALEKCNEEVFDYILLDLDMPEMNGFEALAEIKKLHPQALVIGNTANVLLSEEEAIAFGFSALLLKPFSSGDLLDKMKMVG